MLVMGAIGYGAGFAMARLLLHEQESALRRELQIVAGTLHDSLKFSLPATATASPALAAVLPGLCLVDRPCPEPDALIERHAISATDPARFQLRIFSSAGRLLAATPGAARAEMPGPGVVWQERRLPGGERVLSTTIHLHRSHGHGQQDWGYLEISRSLAPLDAEAQRLWWLGHGVFALAMAGMALASWWLAGLAMAPLLEAYRRQEQFSSDAAHELRTPLANLLAVVEAERGEAEQANPSATAGLDRVLVQGQRLQRLIADLLLLASLDQPGRREPQEPCRIAECLEDLIEDFSETAHAKGVSLQLEVRVADARVGGRGSELNRLLANLLSNAIQHSPLGGVVRVELERQGSDLCVAVSDQGPGIPKDEQERIFERFFRSDDSRSRQSGGTGLGLAIARAIARRHHGRLSVQSTPGSGSTFLLQLPALA
jgi:two-component Ni(II)/redox sensor kinase NrsS